MAKFEVTARKNGYAVFVLNSGEKQEMEEQAIYLAINKGQGSDGSVNIPYILVGRHFENEQTDYLITDDIRGGYLVTKNLLCKGPSGSCFLKAPIIFLDHGKGRQDINKRLPQVGLSSIRPWSSIMKSRRTIPMRS